MAYNKFDLLNAERLRTVAVQVEQKIKDGEPVPDVLQDLKYVETVAHDLQDALAANASD